MTLLSQMAGEGCFFSFFLFLLKQYFCFNVFIFDLHMYCDDMLMNWNGLFFLSLALRKSGDGLFKNVPSHVPVAGAGSRVSNSEPDPSPGLEDFMILWLAANY